MSEITLQHVTIRNNEIEWG